MCATRYKVESGMQMILRLTRKTELNHFYPNLFKVVPKPGHLIEMYSENDLSCLLYDIICESLIPLELGGNESGVIIFNTDGKFNPNNIENLIKKKLSIRLYDLPSISLNNHLQNMLRNLFVFQIYNATQLYATIQNLDGVLMNHTNISLIVFDTLTAFYWSEQSFKLMKMDVYLKHLLKIIQKAVKDYKVLTLYTRPESFNSSKENIENLEACSEHPDLEHLNYRIQVIFTDDENGTHYTKIRTFNELYNASFKIQDRNIVWC